MSRTTSAAPDDKPLLTVENLVVEFPIGEHVVHAVSDVSLTVKAGEALCVVEAMKMENILRAERDGVVKAVKAKPGDSLAVDAVIMEFA